MLERGGGGLRAIQLTDQITIVSTCDILANLDKCMNY